MIWWILTLATGLGAIGWMFQDYKKHSIKVDMGDVLACFVLGLLCGFLVWVIFCGLLFNCAIIPSIIEKNANYKETYSYELVEMSDGEYYRHKPDEECENYLQFLIYEETKGCIYKDFHDHNNVYFIEANEDYRLVAYEYSWGSPLKDKLFFNPHSHYTFYIPNIN
jgi:hypothetical protein